MRPIVIELLPDPNMRASLASGIDSNPSRLERYRTFDQDIAGATTSQHEESWFVGEDGPQRLFANRVFPFDEAAALIWAQLMAEKASGRRRGGLDMIIAATAQAN